MKTLPHSMKRKTPFQILKKELSLPKQITIDDAAVGGQLPKRWQPCGHGDNICKCKKESECGYIKIYKGIAKLKAEGYFR